MHDLADVNFVKPLFNNALFQLPALPLHRHIPGKRAIPTPPQASGIFHRSAGADDENNFDNSYICDLLIRLSRIF